MVVWEKEVMLNDFWFWSNINIIKNVVLLDDSFNHICIMRWFGPKDFSKAVIYFFWILYILFVFSFQPVLYFLFFSFLDDKEDTWLQSHNNNVIGLDSDEKG